MSGGYQYEDCHCHPWCSDPARDEAVRAAEDRRSGPLPTMEEAIQQAFGFDEASVQRACDETKTWPAEVQADAKQALSDLLEQGVPRLRALAEASRWGKRLLEARYAGMLAKTGSASSAVEHENKGDDMGTKSEIQAADYRAEQRQREAESHRKANISGESTWFPKSERTERVTLEITHPSPNSLHKWQWDKIVGRYCESVRVVDEATDALSIVEPFLREIEDIRATIVILNDRVAEITDERDAAIRERDAARDECKRLLDAQVKAAQQRDRADEARGRIRGEWERRGKSLHVAYRTIGTLNARVAELEGQLESVADRAAAAETALEAAPAASGAAERMADTVQRLEAMSQDPGRTVVWEEFDDKNAFEESAPAASGNSQAILDGSPAASDAAGTATWFAAVGKFGMKNVCMAFNSFEECEEFANREVRIVPLYSAPQPAPGWLTPEEREAIMYLIANRSQFAPQTPHEERRNAASRVCHDLLARSTPPEVVRPKPQVCGIFSNEVRDAGWFAALAAAGVPWTEVGRE